jgi:hypothetical protein
MVAWPPLELISACFPCFGTAYFSQTIGGLMPELRYDGDNAQEALIYFKTHRQEMRALRRVTAGPTCTSVQDINGEVMQLCGIALGDPELVILLTQTGASLNPTTVHNPPPPPVNRESIPDNQTGSLGTRSSDVEKRHPRLRMCAVPVLASDRCRGTC